jgi:phosphohistidine phosphatase
MKKLLLVRHADANPSLLGSRDFDRTLSKKGADQAKNSAKKIIELNWSIDEILSSPAVRTMQTATILSEQIGIATEKITTDKKLYNPSEEDFYNSIIITDDAVQTLIVVSHNNGITDFVNSLMLNRIDAMQTASIAAFEIDTNYWSEIQTASKNFLFYWPGKHQ